MFAMPLMTACGGDDNENNGSSYTSDEIVELLAGKWEIAGDIMITEIESGKRQGGTYTGNIEFDKNQKFNRSIEAETEIEEFTKYGSLENIIHFRLLGNYFGYSILKKESRNYLVFEKKYNFEIISLTKNTFSMKLNDDVELGQEKLHITMTMVSK